MKYGFLMGFMYHVGSCVGEFFGVGQDNLWPGKRRVEDSVDVARRLVGAILGAI